MVTERVGGEVAQELEAVVVEVVVVKGREIEFGF